MGCAKDEKKISDCSGSESFFVNFASGWSGLEQVSLIRGTITNRARTNAKDKKLLTKTVQKSIVYDRDGCEAMG